MDKLISMLRNRCKRGTNTTQKDWFEFQCKRLNIDFDSAHIELRNSRGIYRISKSKAWPVGISHKI